MGTWDVAVAVSGRRHELLSALKARGFPIKWVDEDEVVFAVDAAAEDTLAALVAPLVIQRTSRVDGGWSGDLFYPAPQLREPDHRPAKRSRRADASMDAAVAARDAVRDYIAAHREDYAGSWFAWNGDLARMTLGFTRDVQRHRAELGPAIDVEARAHSIRELEQVQRSAHELIRELPDIEAPMSVIDDRANAVLVDVVAKPAAAARCDEALRARFGDTVRIKVIAKVPTVDEPALFHHYSVDASGRVLIVYWNSGNCRPLPLEITEADDHVAVRVTERWNVGPRLLYARGQRASVRLRRPLGDRTVIDATTGKTRPRA
jgi:hypothetical protein